MKKIFTLLSCLPLLVSAQTIVVYDIPIGQLINQGIGGCPGPDLYNGCSGDYGFTWTSTEPGATVNSVTVELNQGIDCAPATTPTIQLNSVDDGTITNGGECVCNPTVYNLITKTMSPANYNPGGVNTINIVDPTNCAGFSPNSAWSGAYARVTVDYAVCVPTVLTPDVATLDITDVTCGVYSVSAPTASNDCGAVIVGTTSDPTTFNGGGNFTITWTYDDGTNIVNQSQVVDLTLESTPPVPVIGSLSDLTDACSINSLTAPLATDNCAADITIYDIPVGQLINQTAFCDGTGVNRHNNNTGAYGFSWTSTSTRTPLSITIELNQGIDCAAGATPNIYLNGVLQGTITNVTGECTCTPAATSVITVNVNPADYISGGTNTITIDATNFEGLSSNGAWGGAYARATVDYRLTGTTTTTLPITSSTTITWTYDDGNGNIATQTQNVVITDATAPVADAGSLPDLTDGCQITSLTAPTATDNCAGTVTGTTTTPLPITSSTTITWTYADGNGNTSTQTQNVVITSNIDNSISQAGNTLSSNEADATATYQWIDCATNTDITGEINKDFSPTASGNFKVEITKGGCTVESPCFSFTFVGVETQSEQRAKIYPNPASDNVVIELAELHANTVMTIVDVTGKVVKEMVVASKRNTINLSDFSTGVYFVKITSDQGINTVKFVKK